MIVGLSAAECSCSASTLEQQRMEFVTTIVLALTLIIAMIYGRKP